MEHILTERLVLRGFRESDDDLYEFLAQLEG